MVASLFFRTAGLVNPLIISMHALHFYASSLHQHENKQWHRAVLEHGLEEGGDKLQRVACKRSRPDSNPQADIPPLVKLSVKSDCSGAAVIKPVRVR